MSSSQQELSGDPQYAVGWAGFCAPVWVSAKKLSSAYYSTNNFHHGIFL